MYEKLLLCVQKLVLSFFSFSQLETYIKQIAFPQLLY